MAPGRCRRSYDRSVGRRAPLVLLIAVMALVLAACGGQSSSSSSAAGHAGASGSGTATTSNAHAAPAASSASGGGGKSSDVDWPQFGYDAARNGVGPAHTGITRANLHRLRATRIHIDGTVDSSVVEVHAAHVHGRTVDALLMTTTYGRTLALNARTGARLWQYSPADIASLQGSAQVTNVTPTVAPDRRHVYVATPDGYEHELSLANGHVVWSRRVLLNATHQKLSSPATVSGSRLIVVTDGYNGDAPPYQGHVVALNRVTGAIEHVFNTLCSNRHGLIDPSRCSASDSAIWGRAGAAIVPGSHDILVATGNGPFNGHTDWGDSVLELSPDASRLLHNWTPADQNTLNADDLDLGSASPVVLPAVHGRRLVLQGGKDNSLKLLDLAHLDGTTGPAGPRTGGQLQSIASPGRNEVKAQPAVWTHKGRTLVFVGDDSATAAYALRATPRPHLTPVWSSQHPGTSPVLAGGLLYAYDELGGTLDVYAPQSGRLLATLPAAQGHWNSPIVDGGRIVLPVGNANEHATSGLLYVYRLPGH